MPRTIDPAIHRRRLSVELRRIREDLGLTQRSVASAMDWSLSKIIRIEAATVSITISDLRGLLTTQYGIADEQQLASLMETARAARRPSTWSPYYGRISSEFYSYLGHESSASAISGYQPQFVPGLFQTADYAREIISTFAVSQNDDRIEELIELRLARQEILEGNDRPKIVYLLDESVIRRVVGRPRVMRRQLEFLLQLTATPGITIHIVPFSAGSYRLMLWGTALLEFDDLADARVLHIELPDSDKLLRDDDPDIRSLGLPHGYLEEFWQIENLALDHSTPGLITDALSRLDRD